MDLNYDYGDVVHTHGHIHTKPDSHKQVVDHALKDWCHSLFGDDAEERCDELNDIEFHDIDDGSHDEIKVSDIYKAISKLNRLSGIYMDYDGTEYEIIISGTSLNYKIINNSPSPSPSLTPSCTGEPSISISDPDNEIKISKDDNGIFTINSQNITITEYGLKLDGSKMEKIIVNSSSPNDFSNLEYDSNVVKELTQLFYNLNLIKLNEQNISLNKNLESKQKEIDREKYIKVDEISSIRKLENMEELEKLKMREMICLVIFLLIAICFGIYCIYNFFVLDLD